MTSDIQSVKTLATTICKSLLLNDRIKFNKMHSTTAIVAAAVAAVVIVVVAVVLVTVMHCVVVVVVVVVDDASVMLYVCACSPSCLYHVSASYVSLSGRGNVLYPVLSSCCCCCCCYLCRSLASKGIVTGVCPPNGLYRV